MIKELTNETVENIIKDNGKVLVDFYASWCGPCKAMSPIVEKFAETHADIKVYKCDVEENEEAANMFGVRNLPFIVYINNGELADTRTGLQTLDNLNELVDNEQNKA